MRTSGTAANPQALDTTPHRADTVQAYQTAVERVIRHMQLHLDQPLDLHDWAQIACLSKFHLVRVFDEITGTTPHHFLACLRVQRAKELLLQTRESILNICLQVGYSSPGTFSNTFSNLVGVSPTQFRRLPKRLTPTLFAKAVWHFLASHPKMTGPLLEGVVESTRKLHGFIFVGAFPMGVPQAIPFSGTVLLGPGTFRIQRPQMREFHLLAAFIPLSADLSTIVTTLPVGMVASLRVQNLDPDALVRPRLRLRQLCPTDPPIVMALPALAPWRGMFAE